MQINVVMPNNEIHPIKQLLLPSRGNVKLQKNDVSGKYLTFGLSLAPHKLSGFSVCPKSTEGCRTSCIFSAGYAMVFPKVVLAPRIARTRALFQNREDFKSMLLGDIREAEWKAKKLNRQLAIRLNIFSDIVWEKLFPEIFSEFPNVFYYDYTKLINRMSDPNFPRNYHLTFSHSEKNLQDCLKVLEAKKNVAVVFKLTPNEWKTQRPKQWNGYSVIDGDKNDLRFLDKQGVVVGLFAKGKGRKDTSGFVEALN